MARTHLDMPARLPLRHEREQEGRGGGGVSQAKLAGGARKRLFPRFAAGRGSQVAPNCLIRRPGQWPFWNSLGFAPWRRRKKAAAENQSGQYGWCQRWKTARTLGALGGRVQLRPVDKLPVVSGPKPPANFQFAPGFGEIPAQGMLGYCQDTGSGEGGEELFIQRESRSFRRKYQFCGAVHSLDPSVGK